MRLRHGILPALLLAALPSFASAAERVSVAAAANLVYALDALKAAFAESDPGVAVTSETGASGSLVAQIVQGAPYDVFMSADVDYPEKLVQGGGGDRASLRTFAIGRLVLWTTRDGLALGSVAEAVRDPKVKRIAMANPRVAPYGRAAEEALAKLGVADAAGPKLVLGENITQTAQYVSSGNADAGFVAMSIVLSPRLKGQGRWIEVPAGLYAPLAHAAVLTKRGASNPAARRFMDFLGSPAARAIFERFGYRPPS
jgi:molybdate transport system substrate-binding protein